jgi:hypothetical protein
MNRFYNTLATLAVILTPAAMMATAGWEAYALTLAKTSIPWLAILTGVATAAALECVGILAGETTLLFHGHADRRWRIAAAVLLAYVVAGLYVLRSTPLIFLPVLAGAVYILVGLRAQAQRETAVQTVQADEAREWEREKWRIQQADKTRVKLAATHPAQAAPLPVASSVQASANSASSHASTSIYACKQCKETFSTMQGLGAHVRHSHGKVTHE